MKESGLRVGNRAAIVARDWTQVWKEGLSAIVISERLVIRPTFVPYPLADGQLELTLDPGQAFGNGGHESTRLALEWIDWLYSCKGRLGRVLDVGTGSGVLALAAAKLGADSAVAFDLDRIATREARRWAVHNGVAGQVEFFTGPIEALGSIEYDLVVANLLRSEMLPIANGLAQHVRPRGHLVVSGLLDSDRAEVSATFESLGLAVEGERTAVDGSGECWSSLRLYRGNAAKLDQDISE